MGWRGKKRPAIKVIITFVGGYSFQMRIALMWIDCFGDWDPPHNYKYDAWELRGFLCNLHKYRNFTWNRFVTIIFTFVCVDFHTFHSIFGLSFFACSIFDVFRNGFWCSLHTFNRSSSSSSSSSRSWMLTAPAVKYFDDPIVPQLLLRLSISANWQYEKKIATVKTPYIQ